MSKNFEANFAHFYTKLKIFLVWGEGEGNILARSSINRNTEHCTKQNCNENFRLIQHEV
jgi:hypothetical protein